MALYNEHGSRFVARANAIADALGLVDVEPFSEAARLWPQTLRRTAPSPRGRA